MQAYNKNEATTSLYLMRRFVYLHVAQFRVSESYIYMFFVNYVVLLMCDQTKKTTCIETIEGSIVVTTVLPDAVSGMQSV